MKKVKKFDGEKIAFPPFGYAIWVVITPDPEAYAEKNYSYEKRGWTDALTIRHATPYPRTSIILQPNTTQGTIAHEASHAIENLENFIGAKRESEYFAYLIGYLVDEITDILAAYKIKNKGKKQNSITREHKDV